MERKNGEEKREEDLEAGEENETRLIQ